MAAARKTLKPAVKAGQADYSLRKLIWIAILMKAAVIALIYTGHFLFPFNLPNYQANFIYPPGENPNLWTPLKTWDGQIYLYLADHGYGPHQFTNAFYPLFPFLIRVAGLFLGEGSFFGGLLISHVFTLLAMVCLYRWARESYDERTAFYGCLFVLAFPMGFYLGLLYTESLFLLLAIAFFYRLGQGRYLAASLFAFLLPLTRPTGVLLFLPALVVALDSGGRPKAATGRFWRCLPAIGIGAGFFAYLGAMRLWTGNAFASFEAERFFAGNAAVGHLFHPLDWFLSNFIRVHYSWNDPGTGVFDRLFFLLYLGALWVARRHLNRSLLAYCLVLGLVPALAGNLGSYMRFLLVLFPLFIVLAWKLRGKEAYYLGPAVALQAFFAVRHSLNYFVT